MISANPTLHFLQTHFYKNVKSGCVFNETGVLWIFLALGLVDPLPEDGPADFLDIYVAEIRGEAREQVRGLKGVKVETLVEMLS